MFNHQAAVFLKTFSTQQKSFLHRKNMSGPGFKLSAATLISRAFVVPVHTVFAEQSQFLSQYGDLLCEELSDFKSRLC